MRICECENIRDAFYEPETIDTIKDYEMLAKLSKLKDQKMIRMNVYVKCKYVGMRETSNVVSKKIEILYLNGWENHMSYIDLIRYWYDDYHKTKQEESRKTMCDLAEEYISFRCHLKNIWKIVSVDNIKIESVCE